MDMVLFFTFIDMILNNNFFEFTTIPNKQPTFPHLFTYKIFGLLYSYKKKRKLNQWTGKKNLSIENTAIDKKKNIG